MTIYLVNQTWSIDDNGRFTTRAFTNKEAMLTAHENSCNEKDILFHNTNSIERTSHFECKLDSRFNRINAYCVNDKTKKRELYPAWGINYEEVELEEKK